MKLLARVVVSRVANTAVTAAANFLISIGITTAAEISKSGKNIGADSGKS